MTYSPNVAPSRSRSVKRGRPKAGSTTWWWHGGYSPESANSIVNASTNTDCYVPYVIPHPLLVDQVVIHVTTAVANAHVRIGMYPADRNLQPIGAPLFDSGGLDAATTGLKTFTPSAPLHLPRGRYLAVWNCDNAGGVVLAAGQGAGGYPHTIDTWGSWYQTFLSYFYVSRTYAAFPTPGTAWTTTSNNTYSWRTFLGLRVVAS